MAPKIHVALNLQVTNVQFANDVLGVYDGLDGNAILTNPPVPLPTLKSTLDSFNSAIVAAADGGKTAIIARDQLRETLEGMMRQLGHWVEANCKNDPAIFQSSGFKQKASTRTPAQPLPTPVIVGTDGGGTTGSVLIKIQALIGALAYEMQYASIGPDGKPGSWIECPPVPNSRALVVNGLTPGTAYTFQVRALGRLGYTSWSASVNRIAI